MFGNRRNIIIAAVIAGIYLLLFAASARGYGYSGYGGYHSGPSFWYFGGSRYHYPSQSVRQGSIGGPRGSGGISAGK